MRRAAPLVALLATGLLLPLPAFADAGFFVVALTDPSYVPASSSWTVPPCGQVRERSVFLPVPIPATSTPAPGPAYPLHGDGLVTGYVQNFHYRTSNHSVNGNPPPGCLTTPPTRDVELETNASYVGYLTVPPGTLVGLAFSWKAETVLLWSTASAGTITGSCGLLVGSVPVPATFDPATATCSATATLTASADFFLHAGVHAASATSPLPPTAAFQSTLTVDVTGLTPHHFEYVSTY